MGRFWQRLIGSECEHEHTLVVTSVGVRRTVCEGCGHISFKMTPSVSRAPEKADGKPLPKAAGL